MGEVYRARDLKLKREVAIKILPEEFAHDPDRVNRFQREAEVLASLSHPNIAGIYDLREVSGSQYLVLELVEGETLADRIGRGPIPVEDALHIAKSICEALEAAHEKGIIHRDLKPANIKITTDGLVKVLDFGLAKVFERQRQPDMSSSPTLMSASVPGVILGTAAYMSPEQAKGRPADTRSDIWAFGCVLYEMLIGKRAFDGNDVHDFVAAILRAEPEWSTLPQAMPSVVHKLLRRCLQKDLKQRLGDIRDARFEIEEAMALPDTLALQAAPPGRTGTRWTYVLPWGLAAISAVVSLRLLVGPARDGSSDRVITRLEMTLPTGVELFTLAGGSIAVSPDGRRVAFVGVLGGLRQIYVRALDALEATPLRGTENASSCFFSFDGRSIVFLTAGGVLRKVSLADGLVDSLTPQADFDAVAWGSDDRIVFVRDGTLWEVPASGGMARRLLSLDSTRHETRQTWPVLLPGGKAVLFSSVTGDSWDSARIESLVLATGERRVIVERGTFPLYAPSGHLVFYRDGGLLAAPFDTNRLQLTGSPTRVIENLPPTSINVPLVGASGGTLVYAPTTLTSRLVWVSRQGAEQSITETLRTYANPRVAPDGHRVLVQAGDLWIQDVARATFTRLTSGEAVLSGGGFPVWAPDGSRIVFRTMGGLRWLAVDGGGRGEAISGTTSADYPGSISPDGARLLFVRLSPDTSGDLYLASLGGNSQTQAILKTPAYEGSARFSPDGKWIAYSSNESGQMEVFVRPYPAPDRKWQVSTQGGTQPVWNPNGKELFYRNSNKMMSVEVSAGADLRLSQPRVLFDRQYAFGSGITIPNYDVSPDGQRFAMIKDESSGTHLNVVLNWLRELQERVPVK
jgi:serine/threonine-protein kinase